MIEIYVAGNEDFEHNGDITLDPESCEYEGETNSTKTITLVHDLDKLGRWKYIKADNIIAIKNKRYEHKTFYRIYETQRTLFDITAYARPLMYDLMNEVIIDTRPTEKNGQQALDIILSNTKFKGHSNISNISTAYYERMNKIEALMGSDENSFINRWGGEVYSDNYDIYINNRIGSDNGVRIEYGYNISSISEEINYDGIVTRAIPVGYNGITLDGNKPWVDSPLLNNYPHPKMAIVKYENIRVITEEDNDTSDTNYEWYPSLAEAQERLKELVNNAYKEGLDKPTATYTIDMINLKNSEDYKDYEILEEIKEGDTIHIYCKKLDMILATRVNKIVADEITGDIETIELGTVEKTFFEKTNDITEKVNNIINKNGTLKANSIEGTINALNTKFKALREIAEQQHVRAMLFEDDVQGSKTYGAMCIGSMGFEIASEKVNGEWQWRTFGTGQGFTADLIIAGTLKAISILSNDETFMLNMEDGVMSTTGDVLGESNTLKIGKGIIECNSILRIRNIREDTENNSYLLFSHNQSGKSYAGISSDAISLLCFDGGDINLLGSVNANSLKVTGDKNCLQETKNYKEVPFYSVEDINSLLTITPIEEIYKTELNEKTGNYCRIINFNDLNGYLPNYLLQECLSLEGTDYNIYIDKMSFGDYYIKKYSGYFIVFSDREMEFKYTLMARRKGFEDRDINKHIKTLEGVN